MKHANDNYEKVIMTAFGLIGVNGGNFVYLEGEEK